ncbi:ABC transporter permease [Pontibacter cellulosilyticus]|uniref:ABC transporter permease n=1 Tax=Pontibacter cellulosilyticus TaxID=1720253 RepID=A0A923N5I5_9BACT|nr:ABC transporter permease [Pontibacter cellulosilyticus]MBC5992983.1 ABC transporter permease [Pontibacter cellulosilyticus]
MLKKLFISFSLAQQNIRSRLFHTLLSILGIVIGVAALVTVLSLIDGLEEFAQQEITKTTDLKAVVITTSTYKRVDDVALPKTDYGYLNYKTFKELEASSPKPARGFIQAKHNSAVTVEGKQQPMGASLAAINAYYPTDTKIKYGQFFTTNDLQQQNPVAIISHGFAVNAFGKDSAEYLLGKTVAFDSLELKIVGVLPEEDDKSPRLFYPFTLLTEEQLKANPPMGALEAQDIMDVTTIKSHTEAWLKAKFPADTTDFRVMTNEGRVEQAAKGFLLFRVVMGMIVGISVIVGGIGVMNVLLISVTERTVEIGVRKAMGAKKRDILLQFLAESITVSLFGSILGLLLGILATLGIVPIIKAFVDVPFQAAYTLDTFMVIAGIAVIVGIVFGTYPATRASKLDPVEAIRRE